MKYSSSISIDRNMREALSYEKLLPVMVEALGDVRFILRRLWSPPIDPQIPTPNGDLGT
jgi:hypothetical protein